MSESEEQKIVTSTWKKSRFGFTVYLCILAALFAGYYFYQQAIRYTQSFDVNCGAPGHLYSQIWSWDFVLQGSYSLCLVPHLVLGFLMLCYWYEKTLYFVFVFFTLLLVGYILGAAVYLTIQATSANTCAAVGNPFNDFRICGVCGLDVAWANVCFNTAPYNPPVTTPLTMNAPKAFQLAFTWIFFFMVAFSLVYVTSYYKTAQNAFIGSIGGSGSGGNAAATESSSSSSSKTASAEVNLKNMIISATLPQSLSSNGTTKQKKKFLV